MAKKTTKEASGKEKGGSKPNGGKARQVESLAAKKLLLESEIVVMVDGYAGANEDHIQKAAVAHAADMLVLDKDFSAGPFEAQFETEKGNCTVTGYLQLHGTQWICSVKSENIVPPAEAEKVEA